MITSEIHKNYSNLTAAERKIADYIIMEPRKVIGMTVYALADACYVAPSAVVRFCKAVGLKGFSELKIGLAREFRDESNENSIPIQARNADIPVTVRKVFHSGIKTLSDTQKLLDFDIIENMVRRLSEAKRIFIFGLGTFSIIAADAQYRLSQLGLFGVACTDVLFMNVTAVNLKHGDVVLELSRKDSNLKGAGICL